MNWRGRPLTSHEVIVQSIAATTTRTGLRVHAQPDTGQYPTGVQVSDEVLAALPITRHRFHGDWNYTLRPASGETRPVTRPQAHPAPAARGPYRAPTASQPRADVQATPARMPCGAPAVEWRAQVLPSHLSASGKVELAPPCDPTASQLLADAHAMAASSLPGDPGLRTAWPAHLRPFHDQAAAR
jgi:hypothetical protein